MATEVVEPGHQIPEATITRWLDIRPDQEIAVHITRDAFDHLFFSIRDLQNAVFSLKAAVIASSSGDPNASALLGLSQKQIFQSSDHLSQMMDYVMAHAEPLA